VSLTPPIGTWRQSAFRFVSAHRRNPIVRRAAAAATAFLAAYDNDDGDLAHDGELDLLRRLATRRPQVVLDVGAHRGAWSLAAAEALTDATVYAIEPAPPNLEILRERTRGAARIEVRETALGNAPGRSALAYDVQHASMATLVPAGSTTTDETFDVAVTTGDRLLAEEGIDVVDFLKIDAEGWDLAVLRGFRGALTEGRIRMVQFEVSPWNAVVGVWLRDFVETLVPARFVLGRIYPGYVERLDYGYWHEDFRYRGNMLAVQADDEWCPWLFGRGPDAAP
jgi:FkbM family methyltransferase